MIRPDFEWGCECGYYYCDCCGTPWYPMECLPEDPGDGGPRRCPECDFPLQSGYCQLDRFPRMVLGHAVEAARREGWDLCVTALGNLPAGCFGNKFMDQLELARKDIGI